MCMDVFYFVFPLVASVLTFTIIRNAHILKSGGTDTTASQKYALRTYEMIESILYAGQHICEDPFDVFVHNSTQA